MVKRIISAALAATALFAVLSPGTANAGGYGCTGNLVGSWPLYYKAMDMTASDIKLYYDAGTGWNCAVNVKRTGFTDYGYSTHMWIHMMNSAWTEDNQKNNVDSENGKFKYYAGPVKVKGKGLCIYLHASTAYGQGPYPDPFEKRVGPVACG